MIVLSDTALKAFADEIDLKRNGLSEEMNMAAAQPVSKPAPSSAPRFER